MNENLIRKTGSLCPECLKFLSADIFEKDGKVFIKKICPEHGVFEELYYGSYEIYKKAEKYAQDGKGVLNPNVKKEAPVCPQDCGLCKMHKSHTALANIVVTNRCDLACWYCFFYAGRMGYIYEPTLEELREMLKTLKKEKPVSPISLLITGGEPTMRKDLVEIIKIAKEVGFRHFLLNTNGIKISQNLELLKKVKEAGCNLLYLSFDGLTPKTNPKNHWEIPGVFENCRKAGVGTVLVPTVIKSINDHEVGEIVRFAFKNIDVVKSVNFQPVSLVGRMPKEEREKFRITTSDVIEKLEAQTNGEIKKESFYPVPSLMKLTNFIEALLGKPQYAISPHFICGMGTYVFKDEEKMVPITNFINVEPFLEYLEKKTDEINGGKNKYLIGLEALNKIGSFINKKEEPKDFSIAKIIYSAFTKKNYEASSEFHKKALFIGLMHFMDLYNYDIERVKRCCIHYIMTDNRIVPFCAFNVIPEWYRDKAQKSHGISFEEWEKKTGKKLKDDAYIRKP